MVDDGDNRPRLPGRDVRNNGLPETPPESGLNVLVTGGAGYIGCVLVERLLARGHRVRVLDRLYWGAETLSAVRERIEVVEGDVRDVPEGTLDGLDGVIHLAGLSNDPTAEYNHAANWEMNALGTESLGKSSLAHGVTRFVFASSCSLYDGLPPAMHDEKAKLEPRGAYAESKLYAERALSNLLDKGLCPVIMRNGTVYGHSPRMRYDLVVNTFVKDALLTGQLFLHGGGWMWRPLVDIRDAADALILGLEAPEPDVRGETFNVLHANYQIRELAMLVAGSVQLNGRTVELQETELPSMTRNYECSNAKLAQRLGFIPSHSVVDAVDDLLRRIDVSDPARLTDPRCYNIRWLELLDELKPRLESYSSVL
jgi:nucleoside-diphosphate-sugar epimerase